MFMEVKINIVINLYIEWWTYLNGVDFGVEKKSFRFEKSGVVLWSTGLYFLTMLLNNILTL